ncbi:MAG: GGDEF domain-containing protein [Planctomycetota bacterium]
MSETLKLYRLILRFAALVGAAAVLSGAAAVVYWRFAQGVSPLALAGGILLVASGLAASACAMLLESAETELPKLRLERDLLRAECGAERTRATGLERRAENLSLVREIHRSTNIVTRGERLRQLLSVLGQLGEDVEAVLFAAADPVPTIQGGRRRGGRDAVEPGARLRPAAYLRAGEPGAVPSSAGGELGRHVCRETGAAGTPGSARAALTRAGTSGDLFLRFDRDFADRGALDVADAASASHGARRELAGDLVLDGERVGRIEARLESAAAADGLGPERTLAGLLAEADLDCETAAAAVTHGQVLRAHDPSKGCIELIYPLTAEGSNVGALRVRLPTSELGGGARSLGELEEVLAECTRHVALALKKETDADRATTDGLTGLLMKREFEPRLGEALVATTGERKPVALLVIDIDHFKKVNDTYGHRSGDIVLRGVAALVRRHIRAPDTAFRYGGEEICVVLPGSGVREAKATAERLRAAVEEASFSGDAGHDVRVTISVGLAAFDPRRTRSPRKRAVNGADLFRRADAAVYRAKEAGRNQVVAWNSRMRTRPGASSRRRKPARRKTSSARRVRKAA